MQTAPAIDLSASQICPCGCGVMHKIGEDRTERLDIAQSQLRVIVTVRPKFACRICTDGVTQVPAPSHLIMGGLPIEATLATGPRAARIHPAWFTSTPLVARARMLKPSSPASMALCRSTATQATTA